MCFFSIHSLLFPQLRFALSPYNTQVLPRIRSFTQYRENVTNITCMRSVCGSYWHRGHRSLAPVNQFLVAFDQVTPGHWTAHTQTGIHTLITGPCLMFSCGLVRCLKVHVLALKCYQSRHTPHLPRATPATVRRSYLSLVRPRVPCQCFSETGARHGCEVGQVRRERGRGRGKQG